MRPKTKVEWPQRNATDEYFDHTGFLSLYCVKIDNECGFRRFLSSTDVGSGNFERMKSRLYRTAAPLLTRIQMLFSEDLAKENDFLRQENKILRSKLGQRVPLTESDRRTLVRYGMPVRSKYSYEANRRWGRGCPSAMVGRR